MQFVSKYDSNSGLGNFSRTGHLLGVVTFVVIHLGSAAYAQDEVLEEVVVTASKRTTNLQDTSIAVTNMSSRVLDQQNIKYAVDLSEQVPGLNISKNESRRIIAIRGVGNEAYQNPGSRPGVSFHIDGVFYGNDQTLRADLLDVERIEVIRGPQGTVFGQNSTGGAINVVSKMPDTSGASGYGEIVLGNYNAQAVKGGINLPLSEAVAIRASVSHRQHDGYTLNLANGQDLDDENITSYRAQLLWQPSDSISALLSYSGYDSDMNGPAQKGTFDLSTDNVRELSQDTLSHITFDGDTIAAILSWTGNRFSVKGLFSYQDAHTLRDVDMDRTALTANDPAPYPPTGPGGEPTRVSEAPIRQGINRLEQNYENTTAEINISSNDNGSDGGFGFDWIIGAFFLDQETLSATTNFKDNGRDGLPLDTSVGPGNVFANPDLDFVSDNVLRRESQSLFAQGTVHFNERVRAIVGFRYTEEDVINDICAFNCVTDLNNGRTDTFSEDDTTGKVSIEINTGDNGLAYLSYSTGFKPGGSNQTPSGLIPLRYLPETVTAIEFGYKTRLLDDRVQLNAAAFVYEYDNMHFMANAAVPFSGGVANIPESEISGLEIEFVALITDNLRLDANLTFLDTEVTVDAIVLDSIAAEDAATAILVANGGNQFDPAVTVARATAVQNVIGNELAKVPDLTVNIRLTHTYDTGSANLTSSLMYTHRDQLFYRVFNNPETDIIPAYDKMDFAVMYEPHDRDWFAELAIRNVGDEDAVNSQFTDTFGVSASSVEYLAPRLIQVRVGVNF